MLVIFQQKSTAIDRNYRIETLLTSNILQNETLALSHEAIKDGEKVTLLLIYVT